MIGIVFVVIATIIVINLSKAKSTNDTAVKGKRGGETTKVGRESLSEEVLNSYTAKMEEAHKRLIEDGREIYPGFPWSAVYTPSAMKSVLLGNDGTLIGSSDYDLHLYGLGRFKLSIEAYAKYGANPTREVVDYIEKHNMNPDIDEALAWYQKIHGEQYLS